MENKIRQHVGGMSHIGRTQLLKDWELFEQTGSIGDSVLRATADRGSGVCLLKISKILIVLFPSVNVDII